MKRELAVSLRAAAEKAAEQFSRPDRKFNSTGETFKYWGTEVLSEHTAAVILLKNTGKYVVLFFYYVRGFWNNPWVYFVPTDSHILGMEQIGAVKQRVERLNFHQNFDPGSKGG